MPRRLRLFFPGQPQFVTLRCLDRMFLLVPTREVERVVGMLVARGQDLYPVKVHGYLAMSTHLHAILSADDPNAIKEFLRYVHGQLSDRLNRLHGRSGPSWERRYSASALVDDATAFDKLVYLYLNPVRAGLCKRAEQWIGFNALHEALGGKPRRYRFVAWSAFKEAKRRDPSVTLKDFTTWHTLRIEPLPAYADRPKELAAELRRALGVKEREYAIERKRTGQKTWSRNQLRALDPFSTPATRPVRTPQPLCHASTPSNHQAYQRQYRAFCNAYRLASADFRAGREAHFPLYAFPPPLPAVTAA